MTYPVFATGDQLPASDLNAIGLWLVKTQTVGTGVTSVTVTGAFSSTYDNYKIVYTNGAGSAIALLYCYMGNAIGTGYYATRLSASIGGVANSTGDNNTTVWQFFNAINTNNATTSFELFQPYLAKHTFVAGDYFEANGASSTFGRYVGYLANTTQYTSFTLQAQSPHTFSGGTIRVYGYRN